MNSIIESIIKFADFTKIFARRMNTDNFKGVPLDQIYRGFDRWHLDHLPPIANKRDHTVLFQLPISNDDSAPPPPHIGEKKWDSNYVRLPCAAQNEYKTESSSDPSKTVTVKRWEIIQTALLRDIRSSRELEQAILTYNHKYAKEWKFKSLHYLFEQELDETESERFFRRTLPDIIRLALQLPDIIPSAIPLLKRNQNKSISLSQKQIACLLANAFLCTFPRRNEYTRSTSEYSTYPSINFSGLFQTAGEQNLEKIKCLCNYFRRVCSKMPNGVVTFSRRSVPNTNFPDWNECQMSFADTLLHVSDEGTIEDEGEGLLQVDFANKYLGGGVLNYGCVQEEIRFVICPELLCSRLFTEYLADNECITIMGIERFNYYEGYASTFEWTGDCEDQTPFDAFRRRKCTLVAIDAVPFRSKSQQYQEEMLKRELNKAFVGFKHDLSTPAPGVATGNWGCGAFNGNKHLKSLLQLMACVVTERPLVYFTFGDKILRDELAMIHEYLSQSKITIAQLWSYLNQYAELKPSMHLYDFIMARHQNPIDRKPITQTNDQSSTQANRSADKKRAISKPPQPKNTTKSSEEPGEDDYHIEDSSEEEDQSTIDQAITLVDEIEAALQNELETNANFKLSPSANENTVPKPAISRNVQTSNKSSKTTNTDNRPGRTVQSFFLKPEITNETQEKRPRSSLLESLDEDYNRKSPAKMKRNSDSSDKTVLPTSKCNLFEEVQQLEGTVGANEDTDKNQLTEMPSSELEDVKENSNNIIEPIDFSDSEMSEETLKNEDIAGKKEDEKDNTPNVKPSGTKKSPSPMKGIDKSRLMFEKYFNVQSAKKTVSSHGLQAEKKKSPFEQASNIRNSHIVGTDSNEKSSQPEDLMETSYSEEFNSELTSETDHFKALHVESESSTEDIDGSKSPNDAKTEAT